MNDWKLRTVCRWRRFKVFVMHWRCRFLRAKHFDSTNKDLRYSLLTLTHLAFLTFITFESLHHIRQSSTFVSRVTKSEQRANFFGSKEQTSSANKNKLSFDNKANIRRGYMKLAWKWNVYDFYSSSFIIHCTKIQTLFRVFKNHDKCDKKLNAMPNKTFCHWNTKN